MSAATYFVAMTMPSETQALARGLRRRDPELLDRLIEQYHYRLLRYLLLLTGRRESAEDLFQETWIRVLERGHQYDGKRRFEAWLFTIARNLAIDHFRRSVRHGREDLENLEGENDRVEFSPSSDPSPLEALVAGRERERVATMLAQLPAIYREVLALRFQEDLGLEEIARVTATPISTVKSRLYRGLEALRSLLEKTP